MPIDIVTVIDVEMMPMHNSIKYSNNYSKTFGVLWHYYRDEPNDSIKDSESFKFTAKAIGSTPAAGKTKMFKVIVSLKYLSNFEKLLKRLQVLWK